jgi:hypothetical protein
MGNSPTEEILSGSESGNSWDTKIGCRPAQAQQVVANADNIANKS